MKRYYVAVLIISLAVFSFLNIKCAETYNPNTLTKTITESELKNNTAFYAEGGDVTITKNNDNSTTYETKGATKVIIRDTEKSTAKNVANAIN